MAKKKKAPTLWMMELNDGELSLKEVEIVKETEKQYRLDPTLLVIGSIKIMWITLPSPSTVMPVITPQGRSQSPNGWRHMPRSIKMQRASSFN
jgi:hypothetical protein